MAGAKRDQYEAANITCREKTPQLEVRQLHTAQLLRKDTQNIKDNLSIYYNLQLLSQCSLFGVCS